MLVFVYRGSSTLATFVAVYALFGPTYPGIYDKDRGVYTLFYPVCVLDIYYCFQTIYSGNYMTRRSFMNAFCRDYPLHFRFLHSMHSAVMTEKVIVYILFLYERRT